MAKIIHYLSTMRSYITPPTILLKNQEGESLLFMQLNKLEENIQKIQIYSNLQKGITETQWTQDKWGFQQQPCALWTFSSGGRGGVADPRQGLEETMGKGPPLSEPRGD